MQCTYVHIGIGVRAWMVNNFCRHHLTVAFLWLWHRPHVRAACMPCAYDRIHSKLESLISAEGLFYLFLDSLVAELPDCIPRSSPKSSKKCQNQNSGRGVAHTLAIWRKIAQNFWKLAGKKPQFVAFFGEKSPLLVTLHRRPALFDLLILVVVLLWYRKKISWKIFL